MSTLSSCLNHKYDNLRPGIRISSREVQWPENPHLLAHQYNGNNLYRDLRGKTWSNAEDALRFELELFEAVKRGQTREADRQLCAQMLAHEKVSGLDFGVASAVYAVSAAGGIPVTSCNAGCFGGLHHEPFPLVGFYWHPYLLPLFKRCAEQARISAWVHVRGELVVGARTIGRLPALASALVQRKALIDDAWSKI